MGELLPEFWPGPRDDEGEGKRDQRRRTRKVTDIFTWVQCFSSYVAVRAGGSPHLVAELMAYLALIVRVSQDYAGLAWSRYDAAFRRQAALTGNTKWSVVNTTLYAMCFTGVAATTRRCELCLATTHTEEECAQRGDPDPGMRDRLKALESAVLAITKKANEPQGQLLPLRPLAEPCRKWNGPGCTFPKCKYSHTCSVCRGSHPASRCLTRGAPTTQGQRLGPPALVRGQPY